MEARPRRCLKAAVQRQLEKLPEYDAGLLAPGSFKWNSNTNQQEMNTVLYNNVENRRIGHFVVQYRLFSLFLFRVLWSTVFQRYVVATGLI